MPSISANLNIMIKASEKASKGLIRDFGELEQLQVSIKGPSDFVTNADTKAEKIIIDELTKSRKNYSILSEESGSKENKDIDNVWIIDPIDGTINFLHGVPHFAISIALKSNNEIVSGLIYDPIKDEMFYAEKNNGAYFNNKRIRVSKRKKMEECLFASGEIDNEKIKQKTNAKLSIRKSGSAALDMAYVANGRYDGYFQKNLNLWDIAAGIIIVKEAGGQVNDLNLKQNNNIDITASSSSINEQLLKNLINF
jgi:myo-inositol-1(or 4)-monophosphatase